MFYARGRERRANAAQILPRSGVALVCDPMAREATGIGSDRTTQIELRKLTAVQTRRWFRVYGKQFGGRSAGAAEEVGTTGFRSCESLVKCQVRAARFFAVKHDPVLGKTG